MSHRLGVERVHFVGARGQDLGQFQLRLEHEKSMIEKHRSQTNSRGCLSSEGLYKDQKVGKIDAAVRVEISSRCITRFAKISSKSRGKNQEVQKVDPGVVVEIRSEDRNGRNLNNGISWIHAPNVMILPLGEVDRSDFVDEKTVGKCDSGEGCGATVPCCSFNSRSDNGPDDAGNWVDSSDPVVECVCYIKGVVRDEGDVHRVIQLCLRGRPPVPIVSLYSGSDDRSDGAVSVDATNALPEPFGDVEVSGLVCDNVDGCIECGLGRRAPIARESPVSSSCDGCDSVRALR